MFGARANHRAEPISLSHLANFGSPRPFAADPSTQLFTHPRSAGRPRSRAWPAGSPRGPGRHRRERSGRRGVGPSTPERSGVHAILSAPHPASPGCAGRPRLGAGASGRTGGVTERRSVQPGTDDGFPRRLWRTRAHTRGKRRAPRGARALGARQTPSDPPRDGRRSHPRGSVGGRAPRALRSPARRRRSQGARARRGGRLRGGRTHPARHPGQASATPRSTVRGRTPSAGRRPVVGDHSSGAGLARNPRAVGPLSAGSPPRHRRGRKPAARPRGDRLRWKGFMSAS